ncbi:hypothetical protein MKW94_007531 [Papaver nudicaule]|uniref:Uncharacterized protein n=1 Tax=Papaver nudicaule TaxID=74823 RepID=A0AA41SKU9_PAPNU|nr:hypothetical protein [Papaver nudicaule]
MSTNFGYVSGSSLDESHIEERDIFTDVDYDDGTDEETEEKTEEEETEAAATSQSDSCSTDEHSETDNGDNSDNDADNDSDNDNVIRKFFDFVRNIPKLKDWVHSWPSGKSIMQSGYYYLSVFGYYRKGKRTGGYGIMLRDPHGRPVISSASVSRGHTYLYHVLNGVNAALSLAIEHGVYDLRLMCNSGILSKWLDLVFQEADHQGADSTCPDNPKCEYACAILGIDEEYFKYLYPLVVDIMKKRSEIMAKTGFFFIQHEPRASNKAPYCVAKQHAEKFKTRLALIPCIFSEMQEPDAFSRELKITLWNDCFRGTMKYSSQLSPW